MPGEALSTAVPDQVQGDDRCGRAGREAQVIPCVQAAGEAVQQQQRRTGALDFNTEIEPVDPPQHTPAGFKASATARQTPRCWATLCWRSVGTSTTWRPPRCRPLATAVLKLDQSPMRTKWPP